MKITSVVLGIAFIALGAYFARMYSDTIEPVPVPEETSTSRTNPVFVWSYTESERDSIPYTTITATATYEDGTSETKMVDLIEGGCNDYESTDADVYARSTVIICYYAGLGRYYKVVQDGESYTIQRKVFEEASPDYEPPVHTYETVVRF